MFNEQGESVFIPFLSLYAESLGVLLLFFFFFWKIVGGKGKDDEFGTVQTLKEGVSSLSHSVRWRLNCVKEREGSFIGLLNAWAWMHGCMLCINRLGELILMETNFCPYFCPCSLESWFPQSILILLKTEFRIRISKYKKINQPSTIIHAFSPSTSMDVCFAPSHALTS